MAMTTQCAIPSCYLPNRHAEGCDGDGCKGCLPRITEDGYACDVCVGRNAGRLDGIIELTPDARLVAAGLARRGQGASSGQPGSRSPANDEALDKLHDVQTRLTTMARDIAEVRGITPPRAYAADPVVVAARWMMQQLPWLRHAVDEQGTPRAIEVFAELGDCLWRIRSILDGRTEQKYFGPCGSTVAWEGDDNEIEVDLDEPCDGDTYARPDAEEATCKTCGARWSTAKRRAWLDGEVRQRAYRASEIEDAYQIKANTIVKWASRGLLQVHDRDLLRRPRYMLGEVLDLAVAQKTKAAARAADRDRRAAKAAERG